MYVDCGPALLFLIEYKHNSNSRFGVKCIGEEEEEEMSVLLMPCKAIMVLKLLRNCKAIIMYNLCLS